MIPKEVCSMWTERLVFHFQKVTKIDVSISSYLDVGYIVIDDCSCDNFQHERTNHQLTKPAPCQVTHGLKWTVSKLIFTGKVAFTQSRFPKITF